MKGLCKESTDTIPVYTLKVEEAARRTNSSKSNGHQRKFKELVMKIVRSQRLSDDRSSDDGELMATIANLIEHTAIGSGNLSSPRGNKKRTTCRGL